MQAYYCPILFEHNAGHDTAGFIYQDEDDSLIKIVPEHAADINASVKLDGQDIVTLLQIALPILSPEQIEEIAAALKPLQEAFKEDE